MKLIKDKKLVMIEDEFPPDFIIYCYVDPEDRFAPEDGDVWKFISPAYCETCEMFLERTESGEETLRRRILSCNGTHKAGRILETYFIHSKQIGWTLLTRRGREVKYI